MIGQFAAYSRQERRKSQQPRARALSTANHGHFERSRPTLFLSTLLLQSGRPAEREISLRFILVPRRFGLHQLLRPSPWLKQQRKELSPHLLPARNHRHPRKQRLIRIRH